MANAGGVCDNAKKVVEVDLKERGTPLHEAALVADTVGDPYIGLVFFLVGLFFVYRLFYGMRIKKE